MSATITKSSPSASDSSPLIPDPYPLIPDPYPLIKVEDVSMRFDRREILSDISLTVNRNDFIAITGPNGGGKTTLLRIILRLIKPTKGCVEYLMPQECVIGYLPQKNMIDSRFPITVREVIESGLLSIKDICKEERATRVEETIAAMDLVSHANASIGNLSGGQLQRALLGRALISRPSVLVLDEPLSYIDKRFEQRFCEMISALTGKVTILLVSHEMSVFADLANRHLIIDRTLHECTAHHHYTPSPCN